MNDQLLQTSRKPRVSAAACVLAACVLAAAVLAGCVPVQAIRTQLPPPVGTLSVNTPRGSVQISQAGTYEIVAGDTNDATMITVVTGSTSSRITAII